MNAPSDEERLAAVRIGPALRDEVAAAACGCSCHPRPASPSFHDRGVSCPCQKTPEERLQAWEAFLALSDELRPAFDAHEQEVAGTVATVAHVYGATDVRVRLLACPLLITGVLDGLSFLFRERHQAYRITVPARGADALADLYDDRDCAEDVLVVANCGADLASDFAAALAAVQQEAARRRCPHTGARKFCPDCGIQVEPA
jgi:hypothetical protein